MNNNIILLSNNKTRSNINLGKTVSKQYYIYFEYDDYYDLHLYNANHNVYVDFETNNLYKIKFETFNENTGYFVEKIKKKDFLKNKCIKCYNNISMFKNIIIKQLLYNNMCYSCYYDSINRCNIDNCNNYISSKQNLFELRDKIKLNNNMCDKHYYKSISNRCTLCNNNISIKTNKIDRIDRIHKNNFLCDVCFIKNQSKDIFQCIECNKPIINAKTNEKLEDNVSKKLTLIQSQKYKCSVCSVINNNICSLCNSNYSWNTSYNLCKECYTTNIMDTSFMIQFVNN